MKYNLVYDDLHMAHKDIRDYQGVKNKAHTIEVVREYFDTLEVFCKNGKLHTYKNTEGLWENISITKYQ